MPNVNNPSEHRKPVEQILRERGIALRDLSIRRQYTTCPKCSQDRKKKKAECLAVTIEDDRVYWACNHCEDKGCEYYEQKQGPKPNGTKVYYNYTPTLRKVRLGKDHTPPFVWEHRDGMEWKSGTGGADTKTLLFRIDGCKAANVADKWIVCCEGEDDVETCWSLGIPATCNAHGAGKWNKELSEQLTGFKLLLFQDNDAVGIAHADKIEKAVKPLARALIRVDLKIHWPEIPESGDLSDYHRRGHDLVALCESQAAKTAEIAKTGNGHTALSNDEVAAMVAMSPIELAQKIKQVAADKGVDQASVRKEFKGKAVELGLVDNNRRKFKVEEPEPWPEPVNILDLLNEISDLASRYVVLPEHANTILALYAVYTYMPRCYGVAPRLEITGPEKRCGKTTLLKFLHEVVYRRAATSNITPAALFRVIDSQHPTLLIDEVDSFAAQDSGFKNILNDGHDMVMGYVVRCSSDDTHDPEVFNCFGPLAYAHIGELDKMFDSCVDRSIAIHLHRRKEKEKIERIIDVCLADQWKDLRRKLRRFAIDNEEAVSNAKLDLSSINDRLIDNWRPLLAIANVAGNGWVERAVAAIAEPSDEGSHGEMMLEDFHKVFDKLGGSYIPCGIIAFQVAEMDDRPWGEWGKPPKPISTKSIGRILKPYGIKSRFGPDKQTRGYYRSDLEPMWERYARATTVERETREADIPRKVLQSVQPIDDTTDTSVFSKRTGRFAKASQQVQQNSDDPDEWQFNSDT